MIRQLCLVSAIAQRTKDISKAKCGLCLSIHFEVKKSPSRYYALHSNPS
jgi:hypothetical protein